MVMQEETAEDHLKHKPEFVQRDNKLDGRSALAGHSSEGGGKRRKCVY